MSDIFFLLVGVACGAAIVYFFLKSKKDEVNLSAYVSVEKYNTLEIERTKLQERIDNSLELFKRQENDLREERTKSEQLSRELERWKSDYRNLDIRLNEQKTEIENLQQKFTDQFKAIANDILKQNSKEFTEHNQKNMEGILNPLKEKIQTFEKKVDETYDKEAKERFALKEEVKRLAELNSKISEEANNLTKALKGDVKKQGNWGEIVLERILERSGLIKDEEYKTQVSLEGIEGERIQPDVIIFLPDNKHIVVDSKVSLVAYERFSSSDDEGEKEKFIKEHITSLKKHTELLSSKYYQSAQDIHSPDFVLLFVPIESSFSLAVQADQELFTYAWDRKVVIVSPSTLLASLKTIASIWKQERQNKNAQRIAEMAGALYDKFVGFIDDLKDVGKNIGRSHEAYDNAMRKLSTGSGNLVTRAEKIRELGAKTKKNLDASLLNEDIDLLEERKE